MSRGKFFCKLVRTEKRRGVEEIAEERALEEGNVAPWYNGDMLIRFTKHAEEKFEVLKRHGVGVSRKQVIGAVQHPSRVDSVSRSPLHIAQGDFDATRVLRVVYRVEYGTMVIITFYPGRKSEYERV